MDASFGWGDAPPTATDVNFKLEKVSKVQGTASISIYTIVHKALAGYAVGLAMAAEKLVHMIRCRFSTCTL